MYKPKDRRIFRYWDGSKERYVDPMVVLDRLLKIEADFDSLAVKAEHEGDVKAILELMSACREALDIAPYAEDDEGNATGLLDGEVIEVFKEYQDFITDVKKNIDSKQNLPNSTAPVS